MLCDAEPSSSADFIEGLPAILDGEKFVHARATKLGSIVGFECREAFRVAELFSLAEQMIDRVNLVDCFSAELVKLADFLTDLAADLVEADANVAFQQQLPAVVTGAASIPFSYLDNSSPFLSVAGRPVRLTGRRAPRREAVAAGHHEKQDDAESRKDN